MEDYSYVSYDQCPDPSHLIYLNRVIQMLQADGAVKVLDAGCGGGEFMQKLTESGFSMYGIDGNKSAIDHAAKCNSGKLAVASLYDSLTEPFGIEKFDAIISIEVIEHLYSPRRFIDQSRKALRDNGLLIITTPYWGYLKNVLLAVTNRMDKAFTVLWDGGHIKHWSRASLTNIMVERQFRPVAFHGFGQGHFRSIPYLWSGMLMAFRKGLK